MADIELVIKIPDHLYKLLKDFPSDSNETTIENVLMKAVENGTVLPKHSRLIEEDRLIERLEKLSDDKWNQEVGASKGLDFAIEIVESEPTILEATKESAE